MARYFLDTGVIVGYTFLHDLWRAETEEIFDSDNSLYINRVVLFEYCNNTDENSLGQVEVDWETEEGRFGDIIRLAEGIEPIMDMAVEAYDEDELTIETLIDEFISTADIDEEVDEEKREEYIRPTLREFILDELDGEPLTSSNVSEVTSALFATIIEGGRKNRKEIKERVTYCEIPQKERDPYLPHLVETMIRDESGDWWKESTIEWLEDNSAFENKSEFREVVEDRDTLILADLGYLKDNGVIDTMITVDNSDMYDKHNRIEAVIGVHIQSAKDSVADHSYPS
jgi:predicted nucleic acid-binding protein